MYSRYGDEGKTKFLNEVISKDDVRLDFLGEIESLKVDIKSLMSLIVDKYFDINLDLTNIIKTLDDIYLDLVDPLSLDRYKLKSVSFLEEKIENINNQSLYSSIKISLSVERLLVNSRRLERVYYKMHQEFKFQAYLNRLCSYFETLYNKLGGDF